jgi:hypothetical protein
MQWTGDSSEWVSTYLPLTRRKMTNSAHVKGIQDYVLLWTITIMFVCPTISHVDR